MMVLIGNDIIRFACRDGNKKRSELLVNSWQAKHVPVDPSRSLKMMESLADALEVDRQLKTVVIGFAETATAIAAVVANSISEKCHYIHTTREMAFTRKPYIEFLEEHSHAVEQTLCTDLLRSELEKADNVVFIDDEITTGKTLSNVIKAMSHDRLLDSRGKIFVASIINRIASANLLSKQQEGYQFASLLDAPENDSIYDANLLSSACKPKCSDAKYKTVHVDKALVPGNPRIGVNGAEYYAECIELGNWLIEQLSARLKSVKTLDIVGTEECMLPAILCGDVIAAHFPELSVKCHATTRSPIAISSEVGYPLQNGYVLSSVYDSNRKAYLYNLNKYDLVIVITDASYQTAKQGLLDISAAFSENGSTDMIAVVM